MGTGPGTARGHVAGITARLRQWPLGNQVSIWPCSGPGFPISALISGIARYYRYHNDILCRGICHALEVLQREGGCPLKPGAPGTPSSDPTGVPSEGHQEPSPGELYNIFPHRGDCSRFLHFPLDLSPSAMDTLSPGCPHPSSGAAVSILGCFPPVPSV